MPNRGMAPGVSLTMPRPGVVQVTNASEATYWMWPPEVAVYTGGSPWTTADVSNSVSARRVDGGASFQLEFTHGPGPARIAVLLWADAQHGQTSEPWFQWLDSGP
jgi:hypothetical protein